MVQHICAPISAFGFLLLIGTAGASGFDLILLDCAIWQGALGLTLFAGAGALGGFIDGRRY